jgi:DNA-binding beta-propeller fold protein YncE
VRFSCAHDRSRRGRAIAGAILTLGMAAALLSVNFGQASAAGAGYTASLVQTPAAGPALAVDSATDTIYLATNSGVIVVNGATNTVTTTISTPALVNAIAVDAATNTIYLAASPPIALGPVIDVISGATNTVTTSISVPSGITSLAVDSTTNTVYAAEAALAQVTVIDGATNTITTNVGTGTGTRPYRLAVDQSSDTVWAADTNGRLIGIDGATNAISSDIPLAGTQPISLAVNEGTDTIYVGDFRNDQVIVLDGKTGAVITDIAVGPALYGLDVDQSSGVVYASASLIPAGTTWVINGSTNEIEDSIGRGSTGVVVDQATGVVYEPAQRQAAIFTLTAGAANAMSPVITSAGSAGFIVGDAAISFTVTASALPARALAKQVRYRPASP